MFGRIRGETGAPRRVGWRGRSRRGWGGSWERGIVRIWKIRILGIRLDVFFLGLFFFYLFFIGMRDRCDEEMNWDLMDMR